MTVVLHVGAHKTGTSLVQKYFRDRVDDFVDSTVVQVSRSDCNRLIGWGQTLEEHPARLRRRLEAELRAEPDAVVVSHENTLGRPLRAGTDGLYPDAPHLVEALASVVDGLDVRVVFYVRPVASFVESYYLQTVHEGAWHTFDEWFAGFDADRLSWAPVVDALDASFGDRAIIGDFDEIREGQEEFLTRFMQRTGIPLPPRVRYKPRRNASISQVGLEIALQVNPHLENKQQRSATRKFLQEHFSNVDGDRARPMSADTRARIDAATGAEYERLRGRSLAALSV